MYPAKPDIRNSLAVFAPVTARLCFDSASVFTSMCTSFDNSTANEFHDTDENDQNDYGYIGHICHIPVMPISDSEVAEAACANHTRHRGQIQQTDSRNGRSPCNGCYAFLQVDAKDDFNGTGTHRQATFPATVRDGIKLKC